MEKLLERQTLCKWNAYCSVTTMDCMCLSVGVYVCECEMKSAFGCARSAIAHTIILLMLMHENDDTIQK